MTLQTRQLQDIIADSNQAGVEEIFEIHPIASIAYLPYEFVVRK